MRSHGNSPCLGVYRTCFEPDGITLARPTRKLSLPLPLANIDVSFQEGRYVMVGDFLGLSNFLEIRALESTEGEIWRPLRGTVDGLLVRADEGIVFTPHVSWRDGNVMTLLFSTRSSLTNLEDKTTLHRWTISVPPARSDALSTMRVGPSVSGAPASGQQMVGTEARERDREGADDETELQYTDPPLALPPGDSLSAFEGDVPLGNLLTGDGGRAEGDHAPESRSLARGVDDRFAQPSGDGPRLPVESEAAPP